MSPETTDAKDVLQTWAKPKGDILNRKVPKYY